MILVSIVNACIYLGYWIELIVTSFFDCYILLWLRTIRGVTWGGLGPPKEKEKKKEKKKIEREKRKEERKKEGNYE